MRMNHNFAPARSMPSTPVTFICNSCGCVQHRRTAVLPEGWTTREDGEDVHALCADCTDGVEPAVVAAQLRADNRAAAAIIPAAIIGFVAVWAMLPA